MKNRKKWWLIVRTILIVLYLTSVFLYPSKDDSQLFGRTIMISVLGITFIMDLYQYRKDKSNKS